MLLFWQIMKDVDSCHATGNDKRNLIQRTANEIRSERATHIITRNFGRLVKSRATFYSENHMLEIELIKLSTHFRPSDVAR